MTFYSSSICLKSFIICAELNKIFYDNCAYQWTSRFTHRDVIHQTASPFCFAVKCVWRKAVRFVLRIVLRLVCGLERLGAIIGRGGARLVFGGVVAPCGLRADLPPCFEGGSQPSYRHTIGCRVVVFA